VQLSAPVFNSPTEQNENNFPKFSECWHHRAQHPFSYYLPYMLNNNNKNETDGKFPTTSEKPKIIFPTNFPLIRSAMDRSRRTCCWCFSFKFVQPSVNSTLILPSQSVRRRRR
jgi:hypothetical protein